MSFAAFVWAWEQPIDNASELLVLLCLADIAGESGELFASHRYIADRCRRSERHVRSMLDALEGRFIRTTERPGRTDLVTLLIPDEFSVKKRGFITNGDLEAGKRGRPRKSRAPGSEKGGIPCEKGVAPIAAEPTSEPEEESKSVVTRAADEDPFEIWWPHFPRRVAKAGARKAFWAALSKFKCDTPLTALIEATDRFAEEVRGRDIEKIPHPATWLNGERWNDEPQANGGPTDDRGSPASISSAERRRDERHRAVIEPMLAGAMEAVNRRRRWGVGD